MQSNIFSILLCFTLLTLSFVGVLSCSKQDNNLDNNQIQSLQFFTLTDAEVIDSLSNLLADYSNHFDVLYNSSSTLIQDDIDSTLQNDTLYYNEFLDSLSSTLLFSTYNTTIINSFTTFGDTHGHILSADITIL